MSIDEIKAEISELTVKERELWKAFNSESIRRLRDDWGQCRTKLDDLKAALSVLEQLDAQDSASKSKCNLS